MTAYAGMSAGPFVLNAETLQQVQVILKRYPADRSASAVMPILDLVQRQNGGWLSIEAIACVADFLKMPEIRMWEVATFYSLFNIKPVGTYMVRICGTTPCALRGSGKIMKTCEKWLGIEAGETTDDGMFTIQEVECLGACANAPVAYINDAYYEDLTPSSMSHILERLADGDIPEEGSQKRVAGDDDRKEKPC